MKHDINIEKAGGSFSKFHIMAFLGLMICNSSGNCLVYNLVYLLLFPKYECINALGESTPCKRLQTCQTTSFTEELTLENWVQKFDLRCESNLTIGSFGSIFFIGKVLGMIFLSHLGDSIGRIRLLRISLTATFLCYFSMTFWIHDSKTLLVPMFFAGLFSCWRTNLAFIYAQEIFQTKFKSLVGTIYMVNDVLTIVWATIFYKYVSKKWEHFFMIVEALMILSIVILFKMPESPSFLLDKGQYSESE